jgi:predicted homoserine dehydrogenase-like protein
VWEHYGLSEQAVRAGRLNAQMFTSFLDGTKSAIEMAAVANATGLDVPDGLGFPSAEAAELPEVLRDAGGAVEVIASDDLRWGVFVVFRAADDYVAARFGDYGLVTDRSGRVAALYRPYHLIGLELGISVASVALAGEPTGAPVERRAEVVAVAKRDLEAGEELDGEGGYTVWGRLAPVGADGLPIGLARGVTLGARVPKGEVVVRSDLRP